LGDLKRGGDSLRRSAPGRGRATFGNMFVSTLLILFVVPVAYTLWDDLQEKLKNLLKKKRKIVE
jgi:hypothetical protein